MGEYVPQDWQTGDVFHAGDATDMSVELDEQETHDLSQDELIALLQNRVRVLETILDNDDVDNDDIIAIQRSLTVTNQAAVSGDLYLTYFTARQTITKTKIRVMSGSIAAGATPTVIKFGVYSVAANGDLTRLAMTANDPTLLAATVTEYVRDLSAPVNFVAGQRYAWGPLVVSAAALPTFPATFAQRYQINQLPPKMVARVSPSGLTDLPASITAAQAISASIGGLWARFVTA